MIFNSVRLPDDIRIALEQDRLVVFAGAGVSMVSPSNLPHFGGLVRQIGEQLGKVSNDNLREDETLGRWAREKLQVHEIAARIVTNESSKPTDLHRHILKIFGKAGKVRVITTNFDNHFSEAAAEVFPEQLIPTYIAPAVPLGDDFEGIVYLHGAAKSTPRKMVLTDEDFGQAYLTRGWAKDFLLSMFSKFAVLFVGYSHNDVVVSYLARGMRNSQQRWTLVPSNMESTDRERWTHLKIETVEYPAGTTKETEHNALGDFFGDWSSHCAASVLDHSARIIAIASALPPENEDAAEYIDYCFEQNALAKEFFHTIQHPAWLGWLVGRKYVEPLFTYQLGHHSNLSPRERWLAHWLCTHVLEEHPEQLLDLIRRYNNRMTRAFAEELSQQLWTTKKTPPLPRFATWVSLLLSQGPDIISRTIWGYIFCECQLPDHAGAALRIFEMLTAPRLSLQKHWSISLDDDSNKKPIGSAQKVDYEIEWAGDDELYGLKKSWDSGLRILIEEEGERAMGIATRHLTEAHALLRDVDKVNVHYDSLSWGRSSIADHEQDESPIKECVSLLITVCRDVLEHWLKTNRSRALAQIDIWRSFDQPLFRRLTLHGVTLDTGRNADAKLRWLLKSDQLFALGTKKEVFDLLAIAYPDATAKMRHRIILRIRKGIIGTHDEKLDSKTITYEKFNVLHWLKRHTPGCSEIEKELKEIENSHPDFEIRDHPEFDHWHGEETIVDRNEEFDFAQTIAKPVDSYIENLLRAKEDSFRYNRWFYLSKLPVLFGQDREWGARFMEALAHREIEDRDLWSNAFSGWRELLKTQDDWIWMLDLCEKLPREPAILGGIAYATSHGFWNETSAVTDDMVSRADTLLQAAWNACRDDPESMGTSNFDWLTDAINHRGGWIADFWIHHLFYLRRKAGNSWKRTPRKYQSNLLQALDGTNAVRSYTRIALIPWIAYLFAWDKKLVQDHFLPLFDWKHDPIAAQQSWSVFLDYRRASNSEWELDLLNYLKEFMVQLNPMLKDVTAQEGQFRNRTLNQLGLHLARLAICAIPNPIESHFFTDFLPIAPDKVRTAIANGMGQQLIKIAREDQARIWQNWLKTYLKDRVAGIPAALSFNEANAIARWIVEMGPLFPEAAEIVAKMPLRKASAYSIIKNISEKKLADRYPEITCAFCNQVLEADGHSGWNGSLQNLYDTFRTHIPESPEYKRFLEILYERGWNPEC